MTETASYCCYHSIVTSLRFYTIFNSFLFVIISRDIVRFLQRLLNLKTLLACYAENIDKDEISVACEVYIRTLK